MALHSISGAYFKHGSEGLSELGKQEGLRRIRNSAGWIALTVMGIALVIIIMLVFTNKIPGLASRAGGWYGGIFTSFVIGSAPIIWGVARTHVNLSYLRKELSAEKQGKFLGAPQRQGFEQYESL